MGDEDGKLDTRARTPSREVTDSLEMEPVTGDSFEQELGALLGADEGPAMLALEGRVVAGKYRLESLIGEGGMGQVYRATHLETGGSHAVKLLLPGASERDRAQRRFQIEAQNAAALQHPNTVRTTDFGSDGKILYLVMEHVSGEPLDKVIAREAPLPWQRTVLILAQVLKALWEAHEHQRRIVHRDVKPENILICDSTGTKDFVKVADFGISRALEGTGLDTQGVIGTPSTMAPELWRGEPADARTDLYALGCTAYHMLAGRRVFHRVGGASLGYHHLHESPDPLAEAAPEDTPEALIAWVERMLAKDRAQRYASASEALEALEAIEPSSQAPTKASVTKPAASHRTSTLSRALLALGVIALLGAGAALVWQLAQPPDRPIESDARPADEAATKIPSIPQPALYRHCPEGIAQGREACSGGFDAWCDADQRQVACCMSGMVPVDESGICDCAPGGTDHPEALSNGCSPGASIEEQREAIRTAFRTAHRHYRYCYERGLQTSGKQSPRGKIVLGIEIGPSGSVYQARIKEGSIPSPEVQRCILEKIKAVRFPPPINGWVTISYPLRFDLSEDDDAH